MYLSQLDLKQSQSFSPVFLDYLEGKADLLPFYDLKPEIGNFKKQIEKKLASDKGSSPENRKILCKSLEKQYAYIINPPQSQINSLLESNTFTIVTGHQLNIFTGPLYFIYKIVTAINTARLLKENYPEYNFVPVYWMASEDHDFEEINHFHLFHKKFVWNTEQKGAVGRFETKGLEAIFAEISEDLPLFKKAYLEHNNLADATRFLVHELFGKYGLVCLDGDEADLKSLFKVQIKEEIFAQKSFQLVNDTSHKLVEAGYKVQVHPREINFFYLDENTRERIVQNGEKYAVLNTDLQFTKEELEACIEEYPEKFSPNVIMRPVYQESILPNLAYIGGPGEIAYWLQLKAVFDFYQSPFPILMPRNFALILNKTYSKKITKLNLNAGEFFLDELPLKQLFIQRNNGQEIELNQENSTLETVFQSILTKTAQIDKSLEGFVGAEKQKIMKLIENIEKRLKKSEENKLQTEINQLIMLKEKLFPDKNLQERHDNLLNFYLNQTDFIQELIQNFNPFDFKMNILSEGE